MSVCRNPLNTLALAFWCALACLSAACGRPQIRPGITPTVPSVLTSRTTPTFQPTLALSTATSTGLPTLTASVPTPTTAATTTNTPALSVPAKELSPTATLPSTETPSPTTTASPTPGTPTPTRTSTPTLPIITLSACATIWESGTYTITNDIKTSGYDCFIVQSNNVVIDCNNHTIEGSDYKGYGVFIRKWGFPIQQTPTNVEVRNCRVRHHRTGIFVAGGNNIYLHHNELSDNLDTVDPQRFGIFLGMTEGGGLRFDSVQVGRVEYNTANNQAIGIDLRDSKHVTVRHNTVASNSAWGISLLNTSDSQVTNNIARNNIRYCAWGNGTVGRGCDAGGIILQDGASRNVVSENTITGENGNGIFIKAHASRCGDHNLIQGNTIVDAVYNAIEFSFCNGNRVIGNEIAGSYDAIWFGFSSNTEIRNNRIANMRNHGITSFNSRNTIVAENQIANSREGIFLYWDKWDPKQFFFLTPTADNYASRDNTLNDNVLRDNEVAGIHLSNTTQTRVTGNTYVKNGRDLWTEGQSTGNSH